MILEALKSGKYPVPLWAKLSYLLLMAVLTQALFSFMRCHFMSFSLFT
jgi:hypothetical protein